MEMFQKSSLLQLILSSAQICREVIFQVIKGGFSTVIMGISLAITQVWCITI